MIGPKDLLADLQKQLRSLERDLLAQAESDAVINSRLRRRYSDAVARSRTGLSFETWRGQQLTQVAAGWVLACVYTRFCEDNGLLDQPMLAGSGERLAEARERQTDYFRQHPAESDLDYLRAAIRRLEEYEATRALVDRHNPMHLAGPSPDVATGLLEFWRRIDPAAGTLVHDFTDEHLGTRFLGDLYQDLSERARKYYALYQTPEFIEEFILDRTLDPAIDEYGLAEVRLIDPACGSGHFLLGAFTRLLNCWRQQEPGTNIRVLVERVLAQVHGVDINPYAAAIARFRLMVAALTACRTTRMADAPAWKIRIAIGDSLRFGVRHGQDVLEGVTEHALTGISGEGDFVYEYEDAAELQAILGQRYHAVVANPPYPPVKDPTLNRLYRKLWDACSGQYALSVPFAQRLFDLAIDGGFTGQITANSFMKREFGKKLIEQFFPTVDLTLVLDTSGAYIPGHGTPTVIIGGRSRRPLARTVRAVLGIRGESGVPQEPAKGLVWTSIVENVDNPGVQTEYVSVADLDRSALAKYPWSLAGGGAVDLMARINSAAQYTLERWVEAIGFMAVTREDDAYFLDARTASRMGLITEEARPVIGGSSIRNWLLMPENVALFPYSKDGTEAIASYKTIRHLWRYRAHLALRRALSGTQEDRGLAWFEYSDFHPDRWMSTNKLGFAFVETHNHFVSAPTGVLFIRSAPVIKLPDTATQKDHSRLIGLLNSSTACFWLKQVSHNKGNRGGERSTARFGWENFYEFTGTKLQKFPLPDGAPIALAVQLEELSRDLQQAIPTSLIAETVPTRASLDAARGEWEAIRAQMISAQEELDWQVYGFYGLLGDDAIDLIADTLPKPPLTLGERAFEIALARHIAAGKAGPEWFARHRSTPKTELPTIWSAEYRALVNRRLVKVAEDAYLHLIERPECKRRWVIQTWDEMEADTLREWLLDRLEEQALWFRPDPALRSVGQLADALRTDADFVSVGGLFARDADLGDVVAALVRDQHVPFLATLRYTESGMRTRGLWESTWQLQRLEDAGEKVSDIPVPPKYKQDDFRDIAYWRNRGKLDVPRERFISYPGTSRDGTPLLGWAGWDQLQQAQALTGYITERRELDAWDAERLTPLLAGLAELLPWVAQWHPDVDSDFGVRPADAYSGFLDEQLLQLSLTRADLTAWQPQPTARGRRRTT